MFKQWAICTNIETYPKTLAIFKIQIYFMCGYFLNFFSFRLINSNMNVIIFIIGKALPKNEI
jgi:hypothetical protein